MINVKELRIGNLIEYHVIDNVDGTNEWVDNYVDYDDIGWLSLQKNDERYRPKVLTEEMLVKFGFAEMYATKNEHHPWVKKLGVGKGIELYPPKEKSKYPNAFNFVIGGVRVQSFVIAVQYVHQLQNLYFALTGEELELKEANNE